jgi:hypothetical protein
MEEGKEGKKKQKNLRFQAVIGYLPKVLK